MMNGTCIIQTFSCLRYGTFRSYILVIWKFWKNFHVIPVTSKKNLFKQNDKTCSINIYISIIWIKKNWDERNVKWNHSSNSNFNILKKSYHFKVIKLKFNIVSCEPEIHVHKNITFKYMHDVQVWYDVWITAK